MGSATLGSAKPLSRNCTPKLSTLQLPLIDAVPATFLVRSKAVRNVKSPAGLTLPTVGIGLSASTQRDALEPTS